MNRRPYRQGSTSPWQRAITAAAMALFLHAVAVHMFHSHARVEAPPGWGDGATIAAPDSGGSGFTKSASNCPACHLQQNFFFEAAAADGPFDPLPALLPRSIPRPVALAAAAIKPTSDRGPPTL